MSRRAARCTQADVKRAIEAVKQTGTPMAIEILPDGTIRLVPTVPLAVDNQESSRGTLKKIVL